MFQIKTKTFYLCFMNIKLLAIGKTDDKNLQTLIEQYQKRLSFYVKFDLEIIPDIKNVKNLSESQQKEKEGELILSKITPTDELILLDENGKTFSSVGFSDYLQKKIKYCLIRTYSCHPVYLYRLLFSQLYLSSDTEFPEKKSFI